MGAVNSKQLIAYCGSAEAVFKQKRSHLLKIPGIGFKTAASILNASVFERVHLELEFCLENEVEVIPYEDLWEIVMEILEKRNSKKG